MRRMVLALAVNLVLIRVLNGGYFPAGTPAA